MSLAELGSLGEFVSAIAVLVTLVYLAIQTRQSRIAAEETASFARLNHTHGLVTLYSWWRQTILNNPDISDALLLASKKEQLSEEQKHRLSTLFEEFFFTAVFSYESQVSGGSIVIDAESTSPDIAYLEMILRKYPIAVNEYQRLRNKGLQYGPNFVSLVDRIAESVNKEK